MAGEMAEYRLRGIPAPLWRKFRRKAGDDIQGVLVGLLSAYAEGRFDPASENDPRAMKWGSQGGNARAAKLTAEQRSAIAKKGAIARYGDRAPSAAPHAFVADELDAARVRHGNEDVAHCTVCGQAEDRPVHRLEQRSSCESCGEPVGEGGALCPACASSR